MDGIEAVRIIKREFPEIKIIMLSTYREEDLVRASFMAGTSGYLLKDISPTGLITAIRALESGIMQISPEIVKQLIQNQYNPNDKLSGTDIDASVNNEHFEWIHLLTRRERELFIRRRV